jgi:hypothetical protein
VGLVRPDGYHGTHAKRDGAYLAWCDWGWSGTTSGMRMPLVAKHGSARHVR